MPGRLTDAPGSGLVRIDLEPFRGQIPRDDVAAVLDLLLVHGRATGRILYVNAGARAIAFPGSIARRQPESSKHRFLLGRESIRRDQTRSGGSVRPMLTWARLALANP